MAARDLDDPDLPVAETMRRWPQTVPVFLSHGMLCVGCMVGSFHTLGDVCAEYDLDPAALLAELRAAVLKAGAAPEGQADGVEPR